MVINSFYYRTQAILIALLLHYVAYFILSVLDDLNYPKTIRLNFNLSFLFRSLLDEWISGKSVKDSAADPSTFLCHL